MKHMSKVAPLAAAVALAWIPTIASAQMLEEIIVTAQKRAQSLQDVPISVSAMQGEKIQEAGIANMAALADYVPNLHIANAAVNTNIYMRGVGSGNNQGFEQSVGMYIDGIYMGRGRQYRNAFLDLERVEVLRGPQGTLFGRNTIAGAINITSASPTPGDPANGDIAVAAETNGGLIVEGGISGSLSDSLAGRFAFKYRETDGFIDNTYLDQDEPEIEEAAMRVTLVWQPTDDLDINLKYSNSNEERVGAPSGVWLWPTPAERDEFVPNRSATADLVYGLIDTNFPDYAAAAGEDFETYKDGGYGSGTEIGVGRYPDGDDAEVNNFAMNINWQVGDNTLTSVTGWSDYEVQSGSDVDWTPLRLIARDDDQDFEQFSQEFRIASPGGDFIDWMAGAYYDSSELATDRLVAIDLSADDTVGDLIGSSLSPALPSIPLRDLGDLGAPFTPVTSLIPLITDPLLFSGYSTDQIGRNHLYELDSESWAIFAQGTVNVTDSFRVTLGLRYTREEKDVYSRQYLVDDTSIADGSNYNTRSDAFYLGQVQAQNYNTYAYEYKDDRSTDELIPSIVLQYDVGDYGMVYASFSQGFKSGGFTAADDGEPGEVAFRDWPCTLEADGSVDVSACYDPTIPNDDFEFEDETVDAFEIGGKHTLLEGSMTVNWALFYTEYENLQTAIFKGVGFTVKNAGSSEIKGLEVDTRWAATDNLQLGLSFAWLDATYAEFGDAPCTAIQLDANPQCGISGNAGNTYNDLSGEPTLYASDTEWSLFADYSYPLGELDLFVSGEVNYRDEYSPAGDNDPIDMVDDYTRLNLRIGLRAEAWEIMAYGRNLTDEAVIIQSFDTPTVAGSHSRFMGEGQVIGLRAKYMF